MLNKQQLIDVATRIQRTFCCYDLFGTGRNFADANPPSMCDCKYGATNLNRPTEEANGCPEMREIAGILSTMTEAELKRIQNRAIKRSRAAVAKWQKAKTRKAKQRSSANQ